MTTKSVKAETVAETIHSLTGIPWVTVPISAVYLALGVWLGRRQRALAQGEPSPRG